MPAPEQVTIQHVRISAHAIDRAVEKYGLAPSDDEWTAAVSDVLNGRSVLLSYGRDGDVRCERHMVELCGIPVRMVWNPTTRTVVTLLAPFEGLKHVRYVNSRRMRMHPAPRRREQNSLRHEIHAGE